MATLTPEAQRIFGARYDRPEEIWLKVHFTPSAASQAAGREFLKRFLRPDASHGSQYQYPGRFVRHVGDFLSEQI